MGYCRGKGEGEVKIMKGEGAEGGRGAGAGRMGKGTDHLGELKGAGQREEEGSCESFKVIYLTNNMRMLQNDLLGTGIRGRNTRE